MGTRLRTGALLVPFVVLCLLQIPSTTAVVSETMGNITFECPDGFQIQGPDCYLLVEVAMKHEGASKTCEAYGASLVEIRDEVEARDVGQMVQTNNPSWSYYWVGNIVKDADAACSGYWAKGEPMDVSVNSTLYVAASAPKGRWKGRSKNTRLPFVCRTDACVQGTFRCRNGEKCLSNKWLCDGVYDCEDQSDESNCASSCTYYEYKATGTITARASVYKPGKTCTWVIEGPPGKPQSITFQSLDVEADVDYVEVWGGTPSVLTSKLQARLTGTHPNRVVYGFNNFLIVRLVADLTNEKTGFVANWAPDDELSYQKRSISVTDSWTELTSPYFSRALSPASYVRQYTVSADQGSVITMEVMENGLGDGFEYDPKTLSNINGQNIFPDTYISFVNSFTFYLVSDGGDTDSPKKFRARVKKGCAANVTRANGFIRPPTIKDQSGESHYPASLSCTFLINAPADAQQGFQLEFTTFQLADGKDYTIVYNGPDNSSGELTPSGGYSGSSPPANDTVLTATSSVVYVTFKSGLVQTEGSFVLTFNLACPPIANTQNMMLSSTNTSFQSEVTLTCAMGYAFEQQEYVQLPNITLSCGLGGKWNVSRLPTCAEIYCGVPPPIDNGFIVSGSGDARYGATVGYQCFEGFNISGSNVSTCGDESKWSTLPVCETLDCGPAPVLAEGNLNTTSGNGTDFGSIIQYSCKPGYDLVGFSFTVCQKDGTWSQMAPLCQRILCPLPEVDSSFATLSTSDPVEFQSTLTVTCATGYVINGTSLSSQNYACPDSGDFDISYDVCVDKNECQDNSSCPGDHERCKNTVGSFVCECEDSYRRNGSVCEVINRCTEQTSGCDLNNGVCQALNGGLDYRCVCNQGYTLFTQNGVSGRYIPSGEDGTRPGDVFYINHTCVPKTCGQPPNISDGQALTRQSSFDYGETVMYRCDFGYKLVTNQSSSERLTCQGDDTWDKLPPQCERQSCEALTATGLVLNIYPNTTTYPGDKVELECYSESTEQPENKTLFCAYDSENTTFRLQGDNPHCPAIDCGDLAMTGGAVFTLPSSRGLGASFVFDCTPGFSKEGEATGGNDTVTCERNGRWGLGNLTCIGQRCTDPRTPGGMNQTSASFEAGGQVVYSCHQAGFKPDPEIRSCIFNSTTNTTAWNGSVPVCKDMEKPVFTNCPSQPVKLKLYSNPKTAITAPNATDNSGLVKVTVSPKWFSSDVALDHGNYTVTYTATDAAGLSETCVFTVEVNNPASLPELMCEGYVTLQVNSTMSYTVSLMDRVITDGDSTLSFSPGSQVTVGPSSVGKMVYRVTATNVFGFQRQCAFIVEIKPDTCLSTYISSDISSKNANVNCNGVSGDMNCTVTCNTGFVFHDGSASMDYRCEGVNNWTPPLPARSCVAILDSDYEYAVDVDYTTSGILIDHCKMELTKKLAERIPQQAVSGCTKNSADTLNFGVRDVTYDVALIFLKTLRAQVFLTVTNSTQLDVSACAARLGNPSQTKVLFDVSGSTLTCTSGTSTSTQTLTSGSQSVNASKSSCPTGRVLVTIGGTEKCVSCEPGYYFQNSACTECANGKYQNLAGETQCKDCENGGLFSNKPRVASSQCVAPCPLGFYNNETQSASPALCYACPEDSYLDTPYTATCSPCANDGSTFGTEGASQGSQCTAKCTAGEYPVNNTVCAACPRGYYKTSAENTACTACGQSETTPTTGATLASQCGAITQSVTCGTGSNQTDYHINFCDCPDGYSGESCQLTVDACDSSPCYNGASCTSSSPDAYTCTCLIREQCSMVENPIKYSASHPVLAQETADFEGCKRKCIDNKECGAIISSSDTCLLYRATDYTNGTLDPGSAAAFKSCLQTDLFGGSRCEIDKENNCKNDTCADESFCRDLVGKADCICPSESKYREPRCEVNEDVCASNACYNSATCIDSGGGVRATCLCLPGYTGDKCEINIMECKENPDGCLYNGTCQDAVNGYTCSCKPNFGGDRCENKPDFCKIKNACANGVCYNDYDKSAAVCVCEYPYELGADGNCMAIDICMANNTCQHGSVCTNQASGMTSCQCQPGYNGSRCQHDIDNCTPNPCVNGQCKDLVNNYTCQCHPGYEGMNCENNTDDCLAANCTASNSLGCDDLLMDFKCKCKVGFTGKRCETDINECLSLPCQHNGTCQESSTPGDYMCTCQDGWIGKNCGDLPNFCSPQPCNNSGGCVSIQDDFFCNCAGGTFGKTCETATKLCDILDPCTNASSCQEAKGTAVCQCPKDYSGSSCNLIEDGCSNNPCQNGGTCLLRDLSYTCQCAEGYSGEKCSVKGSPCDSANCPSAATCILDDNKAICLCPPNQLKSGSTCKVLSNDFDICFMRPGEAIRSYQPLSLTQPSLSLMAWVAPLEDTQNPVVEIRLSNGTAVLSLDKQNVTFGSESPTPMKDDTGNKEYDKKMWNQVTVTWKSTGTFSIFLDGINLHGGTTNAVFPPLRESMFLYIGDKFSGCVSQVYVWQTELSFQNSLAMYVTPRTTVEAGSLVAQWSAYRLMDNLQATLITPSKAARATTVCAGGRTGTDCPSTEPDKEAPDMSTPPCPDSLTFNDTVRLVQVADRYDPGSPTSSNLNRTVLTHGAYRVVYMAADDQNNVAFCRFSAYVERKGQSCSNTEGLNASFITACGGEGQRVQCPDQGLAPLSPNILTCGRLGSYNLDVSHQLPPAVVCGGTGSRTFKLTLTMTYRLAIACASDSVEGAKTKLKQKVIDLENVWTGVCPDSTCANVVVTATCDSSVSQNLKATLVITGVPPTLTHKNTKVTLTAVELMQTAALELDSFALTDVFQAQLQKDTVVIVGDPSCAAGYGLFGETCVACNRGSFLNGTTNMCELCPIGSYTDEDLQTQCKDCPSGKTTLQLGASDCDKKCKAGTFLNMTSNQCEDCAKNFYQDQAGQVYCLSCPAGKATESDGADRASLCFDTCDAGTELKNSTCELCPRGFYRDGVTEDQETCQQCSTGLTTEGMGSTSSTQCSQTACDPGYFRNATNACEQCDYGSFQPEKWQDQCESCNNSYTTENKMSTSADQCRFVCPAGKENLVGTTCTDCNRGYYRTDSLQDRFMNCTACNDTFTTTGPGTMLAADCKIRVCDAGNFRNESNLCNPCPIGQYQPASLQTECLMCPDNTTTNQTARQSRSDCIFYCAAGYEVLSAENQTCRACERGYFKTNEGNKKFDSCQKCSMANFTTDATASVSEDLCSVRVCEAGEETVNGTCVSCPENQYQPVNIPRTSDRCKSCSPGTGTLAPKQTSSDDCKPVCSAGQQYNSSSSMCEPCPLGTWNSGNSSQRFEQCASCPDGYVTVNEMTGANSITQCTLRDCPAGQIIDGTDCSPCPVGYYQDVPRQTSCIQCPVKTNTSGEGKSKKSDCTISCPAGETQVSTTVENCTICEPDTIKPNAGSGTCDQCEGNYTSNAARTVCNVLYCDKGYESDGGVGCRPCDKGKYKDSRGNNVTCATCPTNTTTEGPASTSAGSCSKANCDVGFYSLDGTIPCQPCPVGQYKNTTGNDNCTACSPDFTTKTIASTAHTDCSVVVCPAGWFRKVNQCEKCAIGYYQTESGQTSCDKCSDGYTTIAEGSNKTEDCRIICPTGQYRADATNTCKKCAKGSYQDNTGEALCKLCDANYTTASEESKVATDCFIVCSVGHRSTSRTTCEACAHGKFQNSTGASSCDDCASGKTTLKTGSGSVEDCLPICAQGQYLDSGRKACEDCALGTYNPQAGTMTTAVTSCQICPDGNTTAANQSTSASQCNIKDCLPGYFRSKGGCEECFMGEYQPLKSQTACQPCPSGQTTLLPGRKAISYCVTACPSGQEYNLETKACDDCRLGFYRQAAETTSCVECPLGKTTLKAGESGCIKSEILPEPNVEISIVLVIQLSFGACDNKAQLYEAVILYVRQVFTRTNKSWPGVCIDNKNCFQIVFLVGCLENFARTKRSTSTQNVQITLTRVDQRVKKNGTDTYYESETVVKNAFYDQQPDESLLAENEIAFVAVLNSTSSSVCQGGQYSDGKTCHNCAAGTYSTDGSSCLPCGLHKYQNATGQSQCLPCPAKSFTSATGATQESNCTRKCDEPNARATHCSGRGTCQFDMSADDGVRCDCDENYSGPQCVARKTRSDDKTKMIGGIVGGAGAFLLILLIIVGVIACLRNAAKKGKKRNGNGLGPNGSRDTSYLAYQEDGTSERYYDYNSPLYDNSARPYPGRPAVMYMNPAADQAVRDFYAPDKISNPPSRTRSRSYESEWRDFEGTM